MFKFATDSNTYKPAGRSGLLKASKVLLINVNSKVSGSVNNKSLDYQSTSELAGYVPYHADLDVQARLPLEPDNSEDHTTTDDENDSYLVEKIVSKRFNAQKVQYEYLVKWLGYASTENTWELQTNIPRDMLDSFEQTQRWTKKRIERSQYAQSDK